MASEITLFTKAGDWKAEVEAWKNNALVYKSIGTEVTVYHREQTKNIWGNTVTDWVRKAASSISITNVYRGSGPGAATRSKTCNSASYCELKEWAVGVTITLPADSFDDVGGGAILDLDSVTGTVSVVIGSEVLRGEVTASSVLSDSSIW
ncbi:MAG: hypothetical protein IPM80_05080 [Proteobacteria bacterium]|jgi:hypothetical protein|nr:hypothetical protein [Pseudomonadota bacterium]MBK8957804.1 hypothetical protein [Pseudomonadota bacterium]